MAQQNQSERKFGIYKLKYLKLEGVIGVCVYQGDNDIERARYSAVYYSHQRKKLKRKIPVRLSLPILHLNFKFNRFI